jgi:hypothetical protein
MDLRYEIQYEAHKISTLFDITESNTFLQVPTLELLHARRNAACNHFRTHSIKEPVNKPNRELYCKYNVLTNVEILNINFTSLISGNNIKYIFLSKLTSFNGTNNLYYTIPPNMYSTIQSQYKSGNKPVTITVHIEYSSCK